MNLKEELHELFKRAVMGRMDAVERLVELIHPAVEHGAKAAEQEAAGKSFDSAAAIVSQQLYAPYLVGGEPVIPVDSATQSLPLPPGAIEPGTVLSAAPVDLIDTSAPAALVVAAATDVKA